MGGDKYEFETHSSYGKKRDYGDDSDHDEYGRLIQKKKAKERKWDVENG